MNLEEKTKYSVFLKRGTKIQFWKKEEINSGIFSKDELENYLQIYKNPHWEIVKEEENDSVKKYLIKSIPHPESEEAQKRKNLLYSLFCREDYIHIKILKK